MNDGRNNQGENVMMFTVLFSALIKFLDWFNNQKNSNM